MSCERIANLMMWNLLSAADKSEEPPEPYPGAPADSERAKRPPLPEVPSRPYGNKPATSDVPYEPYAKKPALEAPYEPYKGM
jgi:hypothetical protein